MSRDYQRHPTYSRRPSPLPLILAGAAFALTAWLAYDRFRTPELHADAEPRAVTPRGELADFETVTIGIFEENAPSVVHITSPEVPVYSRGYYQGSLPAGTGAGLVWDARGYVVTNFHVVQGRSKVLVQTQDQRQYSGLVVGWEPEQDIAVVKLEDPPSDLRPIEVGSSGDLRVGQSVFAIGNPYGFDHSLTTGVISALNRTIESVARTEIQGVIQVDAAINPGNSGGPLLDSSGRLIGMNTSIYSPSGTSAGISFAVPVDTINRVVPRLIRGEQEAVARAETPAVLGVTLRYRPIRRGVYRPEIIEVGDGSGAAAAGLEPPRRSRDGYEVAGDIILEVDGQETRRIEDIHDMLAKHRPGDTVIVTIARGLPYDARVVEVPVKLGKGDPKLRQVQGR